MFEGEDNLHRPALRQVATQLRQGSAYQLSARAKRGKSRLASFSRLLRLSVFGGLVTGLAGPVLAQSSNAAQSSMRLFTSSEMAVFSVIIGVISAALLSTMWMVRQRGNMESESREIRTALSDANQRISQYQALIADKNRRIVIWDGQNARPELLGQLPVETGAPQDNEFLAFGRWLKSWSAGELDKAIDKLRGSGQSFDMVVETNRDEILEAQGRISGGRAFVRFIALNNLRAELAELKIERDRVMTSISTFQNLLDAIDLPVWQRDAEGVLTWVNQAYGEAVEAVSTEEAVREGREFLTTVTRERIRAATTPESPFHDKISTVVHGNRTFFDVVDVKAPNGSAGIAIDVSEAESVRAELARTLKSHAETLDHLAEDRANHPDLADRASSETDRAIELRARDRQRKLISKIDAALQRLDEGTYGYCEETGEPIGLKRLDARPIATLSIEAQERHERREKVYRDE